MREKRTLLTVCKITSLVAFIAAFIVGFCFIWVWLRYEFTSIDAKIKLPVAKITVSKKEEDEEFKARYDRIIEKLKSVEEFSLYEDIFRRDPFSKKKTLKIDLPFSLVKIEPIPYEIIYMGYIEMPDGSRVGQFNIAERTAFVKEGGLINKAELLNISPQRAKLIDPEDGLIELELNQISYYDKFQARLNNTQKGLKIWVKAGDKAWGYKVLDITIDSVILYIQNNKIVLKINKSR